MRREKTWDEAGSVRTTDAGDEAGSVRTTDGGLSVIFTSVGSEIHKLCLSILHICLHCMCGDMHFYFDDTLTYNLQSLSIIVTVAVSATFPSGIKSFDRCRRLHATTVIEESNGEYLA